MYEITWTEVSSHQVRISPAELASRKGITIAELDALPDLDLTAGLADGLASLADDGFEGLTREDIEVRRSTRTCVTCGWETDAADPDTAEAAHLAWDGAHEANLVPGFHCIDLDIDNVPGDVLARCGGYRCDWLWYGDTEDEARTVHAVHAAEAYAAELDAVNGAGVS